MTTQTQPTAFRLGKSIWKYEAYIDGDSRYFCDFSDAEVSLSRLELIEMGATPITDPQTEPVERVSEEKRPTGECEMCKIEGCGCAGTWCHTHHKYEPHPDPVVIEKIEYCPATKYPEYMSFDDVIDLQIKVNEVITVINHLTKVVEGKEI